jgi:hypothetical protein
VDVSERRELVNNVNKSTGAYELAFCPLLMGLIGFALDRWLGTLPIITVTLVVLGFVGVCIRIYFGYRYDMEQHEANGPWAKRTAPAPAGGERS